ncbi:MAG: metallophosphoesterase [Planctomycetes bacterium]|nr:metallophosphoesterase [Planctomycetota bacterium]
MNRIQSTIGALATLAAVACASTAAGQYQIGFEWNRHSQWTPGAQAGSTANNPGPDPVGVPVWRYEWVSGGPIGSANPWYQHLGPLLVWDPDWFGIGEGAWAMADDTNPPVFQNRLTHNIEVSSWDRVPMVRWLNPLGDCAAVDLGGTLRVAWSGQGGLGSPVDVDVVIAMANASSGVYEVLLAQRVSKPTPVVSAGESVTIPVDIRDIAMDAGDSIVVSCRAIADSGASGRWIVLFDDLSFTNVGGRICNELVVAVFGDYGSGSSAERAVADMVGTWDPDLIVTTGDNNYGDLVTGWESNVGAFYGRYILADTSAGPSRFPMQTGSTQRFFPSVGNHDTAGTGGSAAGLIDYFHTRAGGGPGRLPVGSGSIGSTGVYYDFTLGDAHFWIVDADHAVVHSASRAAQRAWLEQGLASSTSRWNLVFMHHPPYSSGPHGSYVSLQWPFQQWGADAVLAGHDHVYERILVNNATNHDFPAFVTGLGGNGRYAFQSPIAGSVVRYNADYGAMRVEISPQRLEFAFFSVANPAVPIDVFVLSACYADCDTNGVLDIFDFLCFQNSFVLGEPYACDCDPDPACDIFDFLCFQNAFVAGCP